MPAGSGRALGSARISGVIETLTTLNTGPDPSEDDAFARDRFLMRARALFSARLALLALGLAILVVPAWRDAFHLGTLRPIVVYMVMVAYSAMNYVFLERPRVGGVITFVTLCLDLFVLVY